MEQQTTTVIPISLAQHGIRSVSHMWIYFSAAASKNLCIHYYACVLAHYANDQLVQNSFPTIGLCFDVTGPSYKFYTVPLAFIYFRILARGQAQCSHSELDMAWRPQFHPAAPPVCYENDRMPLNRPVTPGSYIPGPFPPPLSLHTNIPRDSRVTAQWTEFPPEQQFETRGMPQQLPPHGLHPQPPTHAWYAPPLSPNINANWSHPNRADQSQSFTVGPHPPHPHQHVWSPSVSQPLLEPYHMSSQWQPTCETGNMEQNMVPADLSPLLPPRAHPLMGDGPPSITQHSGSLVDPFIADWLRIVGSSRTQRSHQQSSTKV